MEAASEKNRGRGRPSKFRPELMRKAAGGPRSRHGQQDRIYAQIAVSAIKEKYPDPDARRDWLFDEIAMTAKWSLLAELGRLAEQRDDAFWPAVEWVLEHRPKTKEAVQRLRTVRTGKPRPLPDPGRAILELLEPYPEHLAIQALERVLLAYRADE